MISRPDKRRPLDDKHMPDSLFVELYAASHLGGDTQEPAPTPPRSTAAPWRNYGTRKTYRHQQGTRVSDHDRQLRAEYAKRFDDQDFFDDYHAKTEGAPQNIVFHASRHGLGKRHEKAPMNQIGPALYAGRDPEVLSKFYGELQDYPNPQIHAFKLDDDYRALDLRHPDDDARHKALAKQQFPDSKTPVADYARANGYHGIVYFDPWATGEEHAILDYSKVQQLGRVRLPDSAPPEQYALEDTLPDAPAAAPTPAQPNRTPTAMPGLAVKEPDAARGWKLAEGHTFDENVVAKMRQRAQAKGYILDVKPMRFADGRTRHHLTVYHPKGQRMTNPTEFYSADEGKPVNQDAAQQPTILYHATTRPEPFEFEDRVTFLSDNPEHAAGYIESPVPSGKQNRQGRAVMRPGYRDNARILPLHANLKNPYRIAGLRDQHFDVRTIGDKERAALEQRGHDGVIGTAADGASIYAVFRPQTQLRSATAPQADQYAARKIPSSPGQQTLFNEQPEPSTPSPTEPSPKTTAPATFPAPTGDTTATTGPQPPAVAPTTPPSQPSRLSRAKQFSHIRKGRFGRGAFVMPDDSLIDVTSDFGGGSNDHVGIFVMAEHPEEFGITPEHQSRLQQEIKDGFGEYDAMNDAWQHAFDQGIIRAREFRHGVALNFNGNKVTPATVLRHIQEGRIPKADAYGMEMLEPVDLYGDVPLSILARYDTWEKVAQAMRRQNPNRYAAMLHDSLSRECYARQPKSSPGQKGLFDASAQAAPSSDAPLHPDMQKLVDKGELPADHTDASFQYPGEPKPPGLATPSIKPLEAPKPIETKNPTPDPAPGEKRLADQFSPDEEPPIEPDFEPLMHFYDAAEKGQNPSHNVARAAAKVLHGYYQDYMRWYRDVWDRQKHDPRTVEENQKVKAAYQQRLGELEHALKSNSHPHLISAVDNGINQWHLDYPVIAHLGMQVESPENEEAIERVAKVLQKLGRLPSKSPYRDEPPPRAPAKRGSSVTAQFHQEDYAATGDQGAASSPAPTPTDDPPLVHPSKMHLYNPVPPAQPIGKRIWTERHSKDGSLPPEGPLFFSPRGEGLPEYGDVLRHHSILPHAKLFRGASSIHLLDAHGLWRTPHPAVKQATGRDTLEDADLAWSMNELKPGQGQGYWAIRQKMAQDLLQPHGYDGAEWSEEDDLSPHQFHIWNRGVVATHGIQPGKYSALASDMLREYCAQRFADRVVERYAEQQSRLFEDAGGQPRKEFDETKHQRAGGQFARKFPRVQSKEVQPALPGVDLPAQRRIVTKPQPVGQNPVAAKPPTREELLQRAGQHLRSTWDQFHTQPREKRLGQGGELFKSSVAAMQQHLGEHVTPEEVRTILGHAGMGFPNSMDADLIADQMIETHQPGEPVNVGHLVLDAHSALRQANRDQRRQDAVEQAGDAKAMKFAKPNSDVHFMVHPAAHANYQGQWQITRFDDRGPSGHQYHKTKEEAIGAAIGAHPNSYWDEGDSDYRLVEQYTAEKARLDLYTALWCAQQGLDRYALRPDPRQQSLFGPVTVETRSSQPGVTVQSPMSAALPPPASAILPPRHQARHAELLAKGFRRTPAEQQEFQDLGRRIEELRDREPQRYAGDEAAAPKEPWQMTRQEEHEHWLGRSAASDNAWFDRDNGHRAVVEPGPLKPKTLYHGTTKQFPALRPHEGAAAGEGIYLAEDPGKAKGFAGLGPAGHGRGRMIEVHTNVKNPLVVKWDQLPKSRELNKQARAAGHDALYIPSQREWVIFDPASVRHTSNTIHRQHVVNALAAGKPVPPHVLAEYPEIDPAKYRPRTPESYAQQLRDAILDRYRDLTAQPEQAPPTTGEPIHHTRTPEFKRFFGDWENEPHNASKVRHPEGHPKETHEIEGTGSHVKGPTGQPIPVYHGTAQGGFQAFDPAKASKGSLYGPGFYFTEDPEIAKEYTEKGMDYKLDRPITRRDMDRVRRFLQSKAAIRDARSDIGIRQAYQGVAMNLQAAYDDNDPKPLENVLRNTEAGEKFRKMLGVQRLPTNTPEVKTAYLNIRKPFDIDVGHNDELRARLADTIKATRPEELLQYTGEDEDFLPSLQSNMSAAFRAIQPMMGPTQTGAYMGATFGQKIYDTLVNHLGKSSANHILRKAGFDGITHLGGSRMGKKPHRVWIAFKPHQIKSVTNRGTWDPEDERMDYEQDQNPVAYTQNSITHDSAEPYAQFQELMELAGELDRYKAKDSPGQRHLFNEEDHPRAPEGARGGHGGEFVEKKPEHTTAPTHDESVASPPQEEESTTSLTYNKPDVQPGNNEELVARVQSGDRAAFDQLLAQNRAFIADRARKAGAREGRDLEDWIQEGSVVLWQAADKFDPEQGNKFTTYLGTALDRRFWKLRKRDIGTKDKPRPRHLQGAVDDEGRAIHEPTASPDEAPLADQELKQAVQTVVKRIPNPRHQQIVRLAFGLDGPPLTHAQIAEQLGVKPQAVQQQLARILPTLQRQLQDQYAARCLRDAMLERYHAIVSGTPERYAKSAETTSVTPTAPIAPHYTETPEFKNWFGKSKVTHPKTGQPLVVHHGSPNGLSYNDNYHDAIYDAMIDAHKAIGKDPPAKESIHAHEWQSWADTMHEFGRRKPGVISDDKLNAIKMRVPFDKFSPEMGGSNTGARDAKNAMYFTPDQGFASYFLTRKEYDPLLGTESSKETGAQHLFSGHLRIENPLDLRQGSSEASKARQQQAMQDVEKLKAQGYDGIVNWVKDANGKRQVEYVAFHPNQFKSVTNKGTWSREDERHEYQQEGEAPVNYTQAFHDAYLERYGVLGRVADWVKGTPPSEPVDHADHTRGNPPTDATRTQRRPGPAPQGTEPAAPPRPPEPSPAAQAKPPATRKSAPGPAKTLHPVLSYLTPEMSWINVTNLGANHLRAAHEALSKLHDPEHIQQEAHRIVDQKVRAQTVNIRNDQSQYRDLYRRHIDPTRAAVHANLKQQAQGSIVKAQEELNQNRAILRKAAQDLEGFRQRAAQLPEGHRDRQMIERAVQEYQGRIDHHTNTLGTLAREVRDMLQRAPEAPPPWQGWGTAEGKRPVSDEERQARAQEREAVTRAGQQARWLKSRGLEVPAGDPRDQQYRDQIAALHGQEDARYLEERKQLRDRREQRTKGKPQAAQPAPGPDQPAGDPLEIANQAVRDFQDQSQHELIAQGVAKKLANEQVRAAGGAPIGSVASLRKLPGYATWYKRGQQRAHDHLNQQALQAIEAAEKSGADPQEIQRLRDAHAGKAKLRPRETGLEGAQPTASGLTDQQGNQLTPEQVRARKAAQTRATNAQAKAQRVEAINTPEVPHPQDLPQHQDELPEEIRKFGWKAPANVTTAQQLLIQSLYGLHGTPQRSFHDLVNETVRRQTGAGRDGPVQESDQRRVADQLAEQVRDAIGKTRTASAAAAYGMDPRAYHQIADEAMHDDVNRAQKHNALFNKLSSAKQQAQLDAGDDHETVLRNFDTLAYPTLQEAEVPGLTEGNAMQKAQEILERGRVPVPGPHTDEWHQAVVDQLGPPPEHGQDDEEPPPADNEEPVPFSARRAPDLRSELYSALWWATTRV